jgi:ribosomal protein S27AE
MDEAGFLPNSVPPRRWSVGADSPVLEPYIDVPAVLLARLKEGAGGAADALPVDYGDPGGLWTTVRSRNPFHILLLDAGSPPSAETLLARFRVLWKFWTQKAALARQGATRAVIRQKYGESMESYVDNLQWAYDQLSTADGVAFWTKTMQEQRARMLWARVEEVIEATLADGVLDVAETRHLFSRAENAGYEREEFAGALRSVLYRRGFEAECALTGATESARMASTRWMTPQASEQIRPATAGPVPTTLYYVRVLQTVLGPIDPAQVKQMLYERRVNAGDSVCIVGELVWQPVEHSQFADDVRAAASRCPRCGQVLVSGPAPIAKGVVLLIVGVITAIAVVGVFLVIAGITMIANASKARWSCARCGYSS